MNARPSQRTRKRRQPRKRAHVIPVEPPRHLLPAALWKMGTARPGPVIVGVMSDAEPWLIREWTSV